MNTYYRRYSICAISDTHNRHTSIAIPECDFLIHAGDMSARGHKHDMQNWAKWMAKQPAKYKICIMGNHELGYEEFYPLSRAWIMDLCPDMHILNNSGVELEGIKFYGYPQTPEFFNWAYNIPRGDMHIYSDAIPTDINVLITHGPPARILDEVVGVNGYSKSPPDHVGCQALADRVLVVKPNIHIFGHIHCAHGERHKDGTSFYNVSVCDEQYSPSNPPTIIEYIKEH